MASTTLYEVHGAYLMVGLVYLAMALAAISILRGRHDPASTRLWCGGAMAFGTGCVLVGLRDSIPDLLSYLGGNALIYAGFALRLAALRRELDRPSRGRTLAAATVLASAAYLVAWQVGETTRLVCTGAVVLLGSSAIAVVAAQLARRHRLRSAALLAACYAAFAASVLVKLAAVAWSGEPQGFVDADPLRLGIFLVSLVAGLYGNLGFIGLALERVRERSLAQALDLAVQQAQREAAQRSNGALQALIGERDEMLRVLAHEVRRPLLNATAVLHGAESLLHPGDGQVPDAAASRIVRAQDVLQRILARIDGTLVVTEVLAGQARLQRSRVEVGELLDQARAALAPGARQRVALHGLTRSLVVDLDFRLVRAALSSLLDHALQQSSAESGVSLRAHHEPALRTTAFEIEFECPPPSLGPARRQASLALTLAQKVALLHDGRLQVDALRERVWARLTVAQPVAA